jgi:hypothetical protein
MDVRLHEVQSVWEEIDYHGESHTFVTRKLRIIDKDGKEYSLTLFSDTVDNLMTTKTRIERHA